MKNGLVVYVLVVVMAMVGCEKQAIHGSPEEEGLHLQALYREIDSLANLYPCDNPSEWAFVPIGDKPCGGPAGYIAYSTQLNTADFLNKAELYTNLQREYNIKWDVISDCMYVTPPSYVVCENGKAKLIWEDVEVERE